MSISIEQLPIIETSFICDCCGGTGKDPLTRDQMKNFIKNMPLWMAKEFVREWKENEEKLLCAECHGERRRHSLLLTGDLSPDKGEEENE